MSGVEGTTAVCFFKGCSNLTHPGSWKCIFHRNRRRCLVLDCRNQVYARKLCAKHGGKKKCIVDGCDQAARTANVCYAHGARHVKKTCEFEGCKSPAQWHQRCVHHGGRRKCKIDGCTAFARKDGCCCRHNTTLKATPIKVSSIRLEGFTDGEDDSGVDFDCTPFLASPGPVVWSRDVLDLIMEL
ncbi:unnamed protein product [Aphanomyces euteiches]|uniref:Uncharacterized protein n=1 Tax=Aphanomyces euteiches TaxID=100861 RepID=A0A6G0WTI7_9STRA|nr:hypothetical protein Ae201684_011897 [Aphanomyces euteiches]KAH9089145.1 hypothetical protein Ae201684P_001351 [Aphanomyces euteiches]KAH9153620.1 hypothetical protein AeRB84_004158 [Aphanomyces euteiches]